MNPFNDSIEDKLTRLKQIREQKKEIESLEYKLQLEIYKYFKENKTDKIDYKDGNVKQITSYRVKSIPLTEFLNTQPEGIDVNEIKVSIPSKYKHLYEGLVSISQQIRFNLPKNKELKE